ncbi:MAG: hypothetical protein RBR95_06350 [Ignavibacteriaceae bacterium]|nr:hypothetical protein [Ignavibacteriaceae bacterium]
MVEFDHFRMLAGLPSFILSSGQLSDRTNATGILYGLGNMEDFSFDN